MLIDGRKVLYSVKAKKLVYPEIPTEGLVCYLDARGKTNNDKHKGTLIDLSGNGNHGTLQNFSFTEESGYVKDLSEGGTSGLKFDGVDDYIVVPNVPLDGSQFTIEFAYESFSAGPYIYITSSDGPADHAFLIQEELKGSFRIRIWPSSDASTGVNYSLGNIRGSGVLQITFSDGVLKVYFNNQKINEHNVSAVRKLYRVYFGHYPAGGAPYLRCKMNIATLYNRALSENELYENYKTLTKHRIL